MGKVFERVYELVKRIPPGRVATYGQIAALLGEPRAARTVGWALHALPADRADVPWHRVINSQGRISTGGRHHGAARQRKLLEAEGVRFGPDDRVDLRVYGWDPPPDVWQRK